MEKNVEVANYQLIEWNPQDTLAIMENYYCPPYITLAHSFHAPSGWGIENRILNQYALQYVVKGVAEYPVGEHHYVTQEGDLLFHRPGEVHSIRTIEGSPYVCISIVFHMGATAFPFHELLEHKHLLGNFRGHAIERMLTELVHLYQQPGLSAQLQCQGLLMRILGSSAEVQHRFEKKEPANLAKMVLVKNYILNHYERELRHYELEKVCGLTRNTIIQGFKKIFGMSPMQYVVWVRVQKAKELAIQTDLSVGEIAQSVGYADVHTFGKMFKKKTGVSLTQYCGSLTTQYMNTKARIADHINKDGRSLPE
ncbi:helix-turn-helix domain-containing protein [Paenibacillus agaridevorans]|uniref:helix-turn-helix domain-containing protein n=1 Tax=Paenibacillus agaridevorans TaxID=171404 RepID=UPI001BE455A0|nr:helix-turn-helix domain-containing protein [Paenibacillus agaridevorans]